MIEQATQQQIDAALAANDMHGAGVVAEAALAAGQRDATLLNIAAWRKEEAGDFASAHALLREALTLAPNDPLIHISIGAVLRKEGKINEALVKFNQVRLSAADNPAYWLERGYAFDAVGSLDLAAADYRRSVALDPASAPPLASLASVAARQGDNVAARDFGHRALALDPRNPTALIALARCDLDEGAFERCRDALAALVGRDDVHVADRIIAYGLLGDALDRLDQPSDAFAAYSAAKSTFAALHAPQFGPDRQEPPQSQFIDDIGRALDAINPENWARAAVVYPRGPAKTHAFLLGYPRSGTTLVENILASAAGVEVLEERPTLGDADRAFLMDGGGLARLAALDPVATASFRAAYWRNVKGCGVDVAGKTFVDMDPLKGIKLPIIAKLFPDARIIVMRRDPRDIVWSCFHTNLVLSAAAYEFTTLEATARHYDALMRLMEACFARLPLSVHELRYDALVSDFDTTTQSLCTFLDLPWSAALRAFSTTASRRDVRTASAAQVRRGLYDGTRQWQRYRAQLAPVLPILAPWIEKFGFDL